jgi:hypothetical protein
VLFEYPAGYYPSPPDTYTIPATVTSIAPSAFADCLTLNKVTIPNGVTNLGDSAFSPCNLTNMTLPNSVLTIGNFCFDGCRLMSQFTFGSGVLSIGNSAFAECGLANITIPNSVTNIGEAAFAYCEILTNIIVAPGNPAFSSASGVLFDENQTSIIQYPGRISVSSFAIPDSVTSIADYAFAGCDELTNIVISGSVTNIGDYAFDNCYNVSSVEFLGNAPPDDGTGFFGAYPTVYYLPGTMGWDLFASESGLQTVLWLPQILTADGSFGVQNNQFGFNISWVGGQTIVIDACTNLADPAWLPVWTNTFTNATLYFTDLQSTNFSGRFYRVGLP